MAIKKDEKLKSFLRDVVLLIVGKQAETIVDFLDGSKYLNEFLIAKKLEITINQTRNILYKLSDHGIVSSTRKKDKRKGWYTYFWKMEVMKALEFLKENVQRRSDQIKNQIESRELKRFYVCERCSIEFNEENALIHEFTCSECGDIFTLKDNTKVLKELRKHYVRMTNNLIEIDEELKNEKDKFEKKKTKELQKEEKEKKLKRDEKRAASKKLRDAKKALENKGKKKVVKKQVKKKVVKKVTKKPVKKVVKKPAKKKIVKKAAKKIISKKKPKALKKAKPKKVAKKRK